MDLPDMNITNGETEWRFKIYVINLIDVDTIRRQLRAILLPKSLCDV